MQKVVYVDILIFLNTVVTFLLLLTVRRFTEIKTNAWRLILASVVGGVYSLILLAPEMPVWAAAVTKLLMCATIVFIAFRSVVFRKMLRCMILFTGFSFLYAGVIYAAAFALGDRFLQVNNGFAYFELSYTAVILLCTALYFLLSLIRRRFFVVSKKDMIYKMEISCREQTLRFNALLDSGNHLRDLYSGRPVILVNADLTKKLTGFDGAEAIVKAMETDKSGFRFRLLPVTALNQTKLLPAFTADEALLFNDAEKKRLPRPCVVFSDDPLGEDRYQALINETVFS